LFKRLLLLSVRKIRMVLNKRIASWAILTGGDVAALAHIISLIEQVTAEEPEVGAVRIDVRGKVAGEEVHRVACGIGQMREATGLSLSFGTLMLARVELLTEEGGVYAPEACLPPPRSSSPTWAPRESKRTRIWL
jgi:hypothetical protein